MMASKKTVTRELVAVVMKQLMAAIEKPSLAGSPGSLPDAAAELRDIDAYVNRMMTAANPPSESRPVAPPEKCPAGTKAVSLRIPVGVINAFRAGSIKSGTSYQTLMIEALADAAEDFAL